MGRTFRSEMNGQYEVLMDPSSPPRLIILGSSRAHVGINPKYLETFDETVYNLAMNGNSPSFYLEWYRKLYKGHLKRKPETVIFCFDWDMLYPSKRTYEQDSEYWPLAFFLKTLIFDPGVSKRTLLMNRFAAVKHRGDVLYRLIKYRTIEPTMPEEAYKGYLPLVQNEAVTQLEIAEADRTRSDLLIVEDPKQRKAFLDLMDEFQRDGVKVVLVSLPDYLPELSERMKGIKDAYAFIRKFSDDRGIPLLDYNAGQTTEISYNRSLYYNRTHLNKPGSTLFSRVLWHELVNHVAPKGRVHTAYDDALWLGDCKSALGDYPAAIQYYLNAVQADPSQYAPHEKMGLIYFEHKRDAEALAEFTKVTELNPNYAYGFLCLGNAMGERQKYLEAITCFEKALRLNPRLDIAYYGMGVVLLHQGKPQLAIEYLAKAASLKLDNVKLAVLAYAYIQAKEYAKAMRVYLKLMNFSPLNFEDCIGLGTAYLELKKYNAAIDAFSRAIALSPANPAPYEQLALVYRKIGRPDMERSMQNKVHELRGTR